MAPTPPQLEVPIFGAASAAAALSLGASRLELNAAGSYPLGGTTPTLQELREVAAARDATPAPRAAIRVMIRPRGPPATSSPDPQDFVYSDEEFAAMREAVLAFRVSKLLQPALGDGFVLGVLRRGRGRGQAAGETDAEVEVDLGRNAELVDLARPFRCVFHRAFDDVVEAVAAAVGPRQRGLRDEAGIGPGATASGATESDALGARRRRAALEDVVRCGFDGVLTAGGAGAAASHVAALSDLVEAARGRVEVIVGGGVRSSNVRDLAEAVLRAPSAVWFHSSCITTGDAGETVDAQELSSIVRELGKVRQEPAGTAAEEHGKTLS